MKNEKTIKKTNGITLIALVITIIILLILIGISISNLIGSGLFSQAKLAKMKSEYASAKEIIEMKLMKIQIDCVFEEKKYTIVEIASNIKDDEQITIEKYYNLNISSIKSEITENLVNLSGIVVSVDQYSEYKFLIGETCKIEGVTTEEITDTTELDIFKKIEDFEKEMFGETLGNNNSTEETKDIVGVGEDVDTSNPIEITTYIAIKSNSKNTLNLSGVEEINYTVQSKTNNISLSENILTANNNADSSDSCIIQITGTYNGQSYTNNLAVYVEPKNKTTVVDDEENEYDAYAIYTAQDLLRFGQLINNNIGDYKNAKVMKDINISSKCYKTDGTVENDISWNTIGYSIDDDNYIPFTGIFDGNGYTIDYLYINSDKLNQGLIGRAENAIIKGVKIGENSSVTSTNRNCGSVVGYIENSKILNCENQGFIKGTNSVGGIIGGCYNVEITESCNKGNVKIETTDNSGKYGGGILGYNYGTNSKVIIKNCYNNAIVEGDRDIGGIIGNGANYTEIYNCYNTGEIKSTYTYDVRWYSWGLIFKWNDSVLL